ncbi:hypothetical protein CYY_001000 [Polysphondylium violaceum]|uniref:G domain-containing protein n=1 Tax=Polysphondylium violaceum TaxID=133409 RepID=A0A8J4VAZ9_9MYCE|nr:hypothetical protein CYY_001000 [Polysphondylium violaceum]
MSQGEELDQDSVIDENEICRYIICFYGIPGSGKSTILNAILQELYFTNSISLNGSVTSHSAYVCCDGVTFMDTPGLSDPLRKEDIIREIQRSLIKNKHYKIVLVCTLYSGRVSGLDINTINTILSAVPSDVNINYGVIYNKLRPGLMRAILEADPLTSIHSIFLDRQPSSVLLLERLDELQGEKDKLCENQAFVKKIKEFINDLQYSKRKFQEKDIEAPVPEKEESPSLCRLN